MKKLRFAFLASVCIAAHASAQTLAQYQSVVSSQEPSAWFKLDSTLNDAVHPDLVLGYYVDGTGAFQPDVFDNSASAYAFSGQSDYLLYDVGIYATNLLSGGGATNTTSTASGSITFLFRSLDPGANTGQRFLFSAGNTTANGNALNLFIENNNVDNGDPNSLKLRFGNTTTTILMASNLVPNTWYYFALTYKEDRVPDKAIWYLGRVGGEIQSGQTDNSPEAVAGEGGSLAIGNQLNFNSGFRNPGVGRIDEFAIWRRELSAAEIQAQFDSLPDLLVPPSADVYQQTVVSQNPMHYFTLDSGFTNYYPARPSLSVNGTTGGFTYDYFENPANAYFFVNGPDALKVDENLLNGGSTPDGTLGTGQGSLSFLFRMIAGTNTTGQRFIYSAGGATGASNGFALFMENWSSGSSTDFASLKVRFGQASRPILWPTNFALSSWYYFAAVYDESLPSDQLVWYLGQPGGTLMTGTNSYVYGSRAGQGNIFVIGNHTNYNARWGNPGSGRLDEFAIWHRKLTDAEVIAQFNALVAAPPAPPTLAIAVEDGKVVVSWPSTTPSSFALEFTTSLLPAAWSPAGSPALVEDRYYLTNTISPEPRFYRLKQ